jgi:succinate dehydrogenase/fumarate reductase flavoprotein subunit
VSYPPEMQRSIDRVNATRAERVKQIVPRLSAEEKKALLESYHPDYRSSGMRAIRVGPNRGDRAVNEFVDILEAHPRVAPDRIDLEHVDHDADVLVIGGGGGGSTAALLAHDAGAKVLLVNKLRHGDSNTIMAEGGIAAATEPDDSPMLHYLDTMGGGQYKNVPELVMTLVTEAPVVVEWLESLGVMFDKIPGTNSILTHTPGGHCRRRSHSCRDLTGLELMRVLRDQIRSRPIEVVEFRPAVELLVDENGRCAGAVLLDLDTKQYAIVRAKTTILATGGMGRLHPQQFPTSNHYGATADGLAIAYRTGAQLTDMDAVQYHPTGVAWPEQMLGLLITEALRAHNVQLMNVDGTRFINELETRDCVSSAIIRECTERGKGCATPTGMKGVWLDTPLVDALGYPGKMEKQFTGIYKRFREYGIDCTREPILMYPTQHYQNGGLLTDGESRTNIPGLYAAGEVGGGVHGRNRLGANSLVDIFVFGRRAGKHAAQAAKEVQLGRLTLDHVHRHEQDLRAAGITTDRTSPLVLPDYTRPETRIRRVG